MVLVFKWDMAVADIVTVAVSAPFPSQILDLRRII